MANDTYNSFDELKKHQALNKDYKISIGNVGSQVTIIAPHGGKIEPRTSDLAKIIAKKHYNYYCFEGIKKENNGCLHITSHNFDEPNAISILSRSKTVVSIHACTGNAGFVYIGGLDEELKKRIANELETKGIRVSKEHCRFKGSNPNNVCNRGATRKGVQLEITRDLRDDLKKVHLISEAVRTALKKSMKGCKKMRRKHSEVTDPIEMQRILSLTNIGRLATNGKDGYPYITPVNFLSFEGNIYFHCAPRGEKLDNIIRDPRVCFEVDVPLSYLDIGLDPNRPICHLHQFYHCVIIRGSAAVVKDDALKTVALNKLIAKHENTEEFEQVTANMSGYKACEVIEVKPASISAKSDLAQNQSEENRRAIAEYLFKRNQPGDRKTVEAMGFDFK